MKNLPYITYYMALIKVLDKIYHTKLKLSGILHSLKNRTDTQSFIRIAFKIILSGGRLLYLPFHFEDEESASMTS